MEAKVANGQTQLSFTWANPAGAAVFRRGDAIWVVFDAPADAGRLGAPRACGRCGVDPGLQGRGPRGPPHRRRPPTPRCSWPSHGTTWTISLGPGPQSQPSIVRIGRDAAGGPRR